MGNSGSVCPKIIQSYISGPFLEPFSTMGQNRLTKLMLTLISFPQKPSFGANGQFGSSLVQNYKTLYIMIHFKDFFEFKRLSVMALNR